MEELYFLSTDGIPRLATCCEDDGVDSTTLTHITLDLCDILWEIPCSSFPESLRLALAESRLRDLVIWVRIKPRSDSQALQLDFCEGHESGIRAGAAFYTIVPEPWQVEQLRLRKAFLTLHDVEEFKAVAMAEIAASRINWETWDALEQRRNR